jgi:xanthine/CO dehydrogenase XdhC/CoxF family maturation factor
MKEIQEIIKRVEGMADDERAVLATVVDVQGSSYRLPGAKMLILESGQTFGTVSGGCLETDVMHRAKQVINSGMSQLFTYDTNSAEDSIFSLNMGCRGVIRILLEPLSKLYFEALREKLGAHRDFISSVIISSNDEVNFPVGKRSYIQAEPDTAAAVVAASAGAGSIAHEHAGINKDLEKIYPGSSVYKTENSEIEVFFERIKPPVSLLIFGAGADAVPLAEIAKNIGWRISVVDHRPAFAAKDRFPDADNIFIERPESLNGNLGVDENTVAVVMSHNYENDKHILNYLLESPVTYIGALGPKKRTNELLSKLSGDGKSYSAEQLKKLFAPVGLDIGATTPEGIALSIIAEIQSFLAGRNGGFLRDRNGSIYDRKN